MYFCVNKDIDIKQIEEKKINWFYVQLLKTRFLFHVTVVDPSLVAVQKLNMEQFKLSRETDMFLLNVTWEKPAFNFSSILNYAVSYQTFEGRVVSTNTVKPLIVCVKVYCNSYHYVRSFFALIDIAVLE